MAQQLIVAVFDSVDVAERNSLARPVLAWSAKAFASLWIRATPSSSMLGDAFTEDGVCPQTWTTIATSKAEYIPHFLSLALRRESATSPILTSLCLALMMLFTGRTHYFRDTTQRNFRGFS